MVASLCVTWGSAPNPEVFLCIGGGLLIYRRDGGSSHRIMRRGLPPFGTAPVGGRWSKGVAGWRAAPRRGSLVGGQGCFPNGAHPGSKPEQAIKNLKKKTQKWLTIIKKKCYTV